MKSLKLLFGVLILVALLMPGCKSGSSKNEDASESEKNGTETSLNELEESMNEAGKGTGEVVDFRVLKDALPETLVGLKRTSHTGQKTGFANIQISTAQADYSEGEKQINVTITDTGGMGMAMAGLAAWANMEMDSETDTGFERTTTIDGKKAFEKFDKTSGYGEVTVIDDNRFIIAVNGQNVSMDDLRDAVKKIDIKS